MSLLANLHITPRPIFLVRHGESVDNVNHRVGGDSSLTPLGSRFAELLAGFFSNLFPDAAQRRKVPIWISTLARTEQTVAYMSSDHPLIKWRHLDEIDAGQCEGLTYEEIAAVMPKVYAGRQANKWEYRWPGGEVRLTYMLYVLAAAYRQIGSPWSSPNVADVVGWLVVYPVG
jgi:6-phosphofructo-2-kinase/fructose-2,6-biphosphatase 2